MAGTKDCCSAVRPSATVLNCVVSCVVALTSASRAPGSDGEFATCCQAFQNPVNWVLSPLLGSPNSAWTWDRIWLDSDAPLCWPCALSNEERMVGVTNRSILLIATPESLGDVVRSTCSRAYRGVEA